MSYENDTRYRAAYLASILTQYYPDARPHVIGRVVYEMQNAARSAVAWEVKRCNVPMTEKQEEAGYARMVKLTINVNGMLGDLGACAGSHASILLGGDPRGPCARLIVPGMSGDGFGDGFAVY